MPVTSVAEPSEQKQAPFLHPYAFTLARQSAVSWSISDPASLHDLADILLSKGFTTRPPRCQSEAYRLAHPCGALCILYHTGAVLAQGRQAARLVAFLERLERATAHHPPPAPPPASFGSLLLDPYSTKRGAA